jgi:Zn-dependent M28 family amino/carboxypeptidase
MKKNLIQFILLCLCLSFLLIQCKEDKPVVEQKVKTPLKIPAFNQDSAYYFVAKQLEFGPRVPGSEGHKACKAWLVDKFKSYGATVIEQDFVANIYTGDKWDATNIIAQFNPKHKERVILSAHWDSRFIGEEDKNQDKKDLPIPGADDAGSGVAVLLEIARNLKDNPLDIGIDIILWDAEDQGKRGPTSPPELWCLGSQYWSRKKHINNYRAMYGINLDMVGAKNARFAKDEVSRQFAGKVVDKVWTLAHSMGYSDMFVNENTRGLTDDHTFVNRIAKIPMIDIINQPQGSQTGFVPHWHTHDDNLSAIDKRTLRVVGQVVLATIFRESEGSI